jgi:hypothetical protein
MPELQPPRRAFSVSSVVSAMSDRNSRPYKKEAVPIMPVLKNPKARRRLVASDKIDA